MASPDFTLLEGDCRVLLQTIPAGTVQCCVTSPPYWTASVADQAIGKEVSADHYATSLQSVFREVRRVLTPAGALWLVLGDHPASGLAGAPHMVADVLVKDGWSLNGGFIWEEAEASQFVFCFGLHPRPPGPHERVWRFASRTEPDYRWSVLPEELAGRCVADSSAPGQMVLDPFCGLGSVGVAALKLGRNFTGIETERRVLQRAWERLRKARAGR